MEIWFTGLLVSSLVLWSAATLGCGMAGSETSFLFWRGVMGITESLYYPAAMVAIANYYPEAARSQALGIHQSAQFIGVMAGGWYGGWAADHTGWRQAFTVAAVDAAGNVDATPESFAWDVDVTAPDTTIDAAPPALTKGQTFLRRLASTVALWSIVLTAMLLHTRFVIYINPNPPEKRRRTAQRMTAITKNEQTSTPVATAASSASAEVTVTQKSLKSEDKPAAQSELEQATDSVLLETSLNEPAANGGRSSSPDADDVSEDSEPAEKIEPVKKQSGSGKQKAKNRRKAG